MLARVLAGLLLVAMTVGAAVAVSRASWLVAAILTVGVLAMVVLVVVLSLPRAPDGPAGYVEREQSFW